MTLRLAAEPRKVLRHTFANLIDPSHVIRAGVDLGQCHQPFTQGGGLIIDGCEPGSLAIDNTVSRQIASGIRHNTMVLIGSLLSAIATQKVAIFTNGS